MGLFGDRRPTGSGLRGPAADLIELRAKDDSISTALWFKEEHLDEPVLHDGVEAVLPFLEMPMTGGVCELVHWDAREGVFVYATGEAWSVAELAVVLKDLDELMSTRAVGELLLHTTKLLADASEAGDSHGVLSHGALTPWRLFLSLEGKPRLVGHGVLQPEFSRFHADDTYLPSSRSLRYAPPERFERKPEDVRSDVFSLGLIALELLVGEPAYLGNAEEVLDQAQVGATAEVLDEVGADLPDMLVDVLAGMLHPDPAERMLPEEVLDALAEGVDGLAGESLGELIGRMAGEAHIADVDLPPEEEEEADALPEEGGTAGDEPAAEAEVPDEEREQAARDAESALANCEREVEDARALW